MKSRAHDLIGQRFGRRRVIERGPIFPHGNANWRVICECGTERIVRADGVKRTRSCGCARRGPRIDVGPYLKMLESLKAE
jgi:hypothetical protein